MNNYSIQYYTEIKEPQINDFISGVKGIQNTIGWEHPDPVDAIKRISGPFFPKFIAEDRQTSELVGYAYVLMRERDIYICQLAVRKDKQRMGVGKALMAKIFEIAQHNKILTIVLEAEKSEEEKCTQFYNSLHSKNIKVEKSNLIFIFTIH